MIRTALVGAAILGAFALGSAHAEDKIVPAEVEVNGLVYPINSDWVFSLFVNTQTTTNAGTFESVIPFIKTADGVYHALTICGDEIGVTCVPINTPKNALGEVHQSDQIPLEGQKNG